jgi:hypothetical protein
MAAYAEYAEGGLEEEDDQRERRTGYKTGAGNMRKASASASAKQLSSLRGRTPEGGDITISAIRASVKEELGYMWSEI